MWLLSKRSKNVMIVAKRCDLLCWIVCWVDEACLPIELFGYFEVSGFIVEESDFRTCE